MGNKHSRPSVASTSAETTPEKRSSLGSFLKRKSNGGRRRSSAVRLLGKLAFLSNHSSSSNAKKKKTENKKTENKKLRVTPPPTPTLPEVHPEEILLTVSKQQQDVSSEISMLPSKEELSVPFPFQPQETPTPIPNTLRHSVAGTTKLENNDTKNSAKPSRRNTVAVSSQNKKNKSTGGPNKTTKPNLTEASETTSDATKLASENPDPQTTTQEKQRRNTVVVASSRNNGAASPPPKSSSSTTKRRRGTVATTTTTVKRSEAASPPLKQTKRGSTPVAFQQPQPQPQHIIIPISDTQETPSSKNEQQPFQQTSVLPMTRSSTPTESPQPPPKKRSSTPVSRPTTPKPTKRSSTPVNNNGTNSPKPNKRSSSTPRPSSPKPTTTSKRSSTPVSRPTTPKPTKRSSTPVNNGRKSPKPNKRSSTPVNTGRKSSPKPNKRSSTPVSRPTSPEANKRSSTPTPAGARGSSSPKPNNTQSSIAPPMPTSSTRVPTMPAMQDLSSAVPSVTPAPTVPKQSEQTNAVVVLLPANNNNRATTTELQSSKQQSPTQDAEQPILTNASTTQPPAVVGSSNNNSQKATIIVTRATNNVRRCSTPVLTTTTTTTTGIATTTLNSNKDNNNLTVPWWHSSKGDDSNNNNNNNPAGQKSRRCSTPVLLEGEAAGTTPKTAEVGNNSSSVKQARRTSTPILSLNSSPASLVVSEQISTPDRSEDSPTVCSTSIIRGEETPSTIMKTERPETPAFPALNVHPTTTQENKQQAKRGSSWNPPFLQSALFTSGTTSTPYPEQAPTESSATTTRKSILPSNRTARHSSILPMVEEEDPSGKEMCPPRRRSRTSLSGRPNPRRSSVFQVNQNGGLSLLFDGEDISDESETDLSFHSRRNSRNSLSGSRRRSNNRSISSLLGGEDLSGSETELLQQPRKKSILSGRPNPRRSSVFRVNASGGIAPMTPGDDMPESETTPKKCQSSTASLFGFSKPRRSVFQMGPTGGITPLIDMSMSESEFEEEVSLAVQPSPLSPLLEDGDEEEELSTVGLKPCPARPRRSNMFLRMMPRRQPLISSEDDDFSEACNSEAKKAEATSPPTAPSRRTSLFAGILSRHQTPTDDEAPIIAENVSKAERRRSSGSAVGLTSSVFSLLTFPSLARRNSTNYTPMDVKKALKIAPKSKWKLEKVRFSGQFDCNKMGKWEEVRGKRIDKGIKKFTANPDKYVAITFQNSMRFAHSTKNNVYTLIHREGTTPINPLDTASDGRMSLMINKYQHLRSMPNDTLPLANRDAFSWDLTFDGQLLHDRDNPPILPGRGMGVGDTPNLKIIGDIDPADIVQGEVGNCWLLSAISALAEFDGAIKKLFRKTKNLDSMPGDGPNMYTISLFDLTTWKEVDIVIDESLCGHPFRHGELLGAQITEDGELWVSYLEKAFMVHCGGGWDDLEGGHCTHAWSMMTGCKEQYFIRKNYHTGKYHCSAKYDMFTKQWKQLQNQPRHKDMAGLEPIAWPKVGGGGAMGLEISQDELFMQMFAWDQVDYIVGASSKGTSEEEIASGMVRNHCYSVIDAHHNVAATGIDLFKVRNPWGHGEIEDGQFGDTGSGWEDYPQIKALLKPVVADDGIFYMTKAEFFVFFDHIYLSACSMTQFKED
ncbi:Calpain-type cysteine protease DEK1 [Seminavis robusta]|uniref:Calpain-type cysteine protease DEK1 n=1 Tax=Seminavis robusta TaxID=568900 RepID=A0A9N8EME7_9STRA|nr:Calpain-type cysteine protease DEK1 [Seminavis robusta]|eukprot:Sro1539_g280830.1 Calpain-type cysteine protease DEK1 (1628) ;mRNA; r:9812-14793